MARNYYKPQKKIISSADLTTGICASLYTRIEKRLCRCASLSIHVGKYYTKDYIGECWVFKICRKHRCIQNLGDEA